MKTRTPVHAVIYADIVAEISSGRYASGHLLPSESELEARYNASRTPIRQALRELEHDGYIYRVQGKGSFVSNHNPTGTWAHTTGFQHHYAGAPERVSAVTLDISRVDADAAAGPLGVTPSTQLARVTRLRRFDDEPVLYLKHYMSPAIDEDIFRADPHFFSKDTLLAEAAGITVSEIEERLIAIPADGDVAAQLRVEPGTATLKILRLSSARGFGPTDVTEYYVRTDRWDYVAHFRSP